jgi:hypothetical protein
LRRRSLEAPVALEDQISLAERIAAELRATIRKSGAAGSPLLGPSSQPEPPIDAELQILHSTSDIAGAPFRSHRRLLGRFIIMMKNFARELLVQLLQRQTAFNAAAIRLIEHLNRRLDAMARELSLTAQRLAELEARLESMVDAERERTARAQPWPGSDQEHHFDGTRHDSGRVNAPAESVETYRSGLRRT